MSGLQIARSSLRQYIRITEKFDKSQCLARCLLGLYKKFVEIGDLSKFLIEIYSTIMKPLCPYQNRKADQMDHKVSVPFY